MVGRAGCIVIHTKNAYINSQNFITEAFYILFSFHVEIKPQGRLKMFRNYMQCYWGNIRMDKEKEIIIVKTGSTRSWSWSHHSKNRQSMATHREGTKTFPSSLFLISCWCCPWAKSPGNQSPRKFVVIIRCQHSRPHLHGFGGVHRRLPAHLDLHCLFIGCPHQENASSMAGKTIYNLPSIVAAVSRVK